MRLGGVATPVLCPICQRYSLKAIHNYNGLSMAHNRVVPDMSKIQSESNSQPGTVNTERGRGCARYVKDTV